MAVVRLLAAYAIVAFVLGHVYLTTTGETLTSNIKAMITGYEGLEVPSPGDAEAQGGRA